jgi:hypothetical protein
LKADKKGRKPLCLLEEMMNLYELLSGIVFDEDVEFVSQDEDGVINLYHSDPGQRFVDQYWTSKNFIQYLEDADGEDLYLPLADDFRTALLTIVDGKVAGLAYGCVNAPPKPKAEFKILLCQEDFDYMMDGMEVAELTVGIVNQILKEQGVDIVFAVEDSSDED